MELHEFDIQMARLSSTFGKTAYPDERRKMIWREVSSLSSGAFSNIIERLISESRQAPLLPEIRELAAGYRVKQTKYAQNNGGYSCSICGGGGSLIARRKDDKSPWAFKCSCTAGRNDVRRFPPWQESFRETYEVTNA